MPIRTRRHAGTLCVVVAQMVRRRRAFAGGVDADGGLKEKPGYRRKRGALDGVSWV